MKYNINAVLREDQLRKVTSIFKRENMKLSLTETMLPKPFQHLTWEEVGAVDPKTDLFLLGKPSKTVEVDSFKGPHQNDDISFNLNHLMTEY